MWLALPAFLLLSRIANHVQALGLQARHDLPRRHGSIGPTQYITRLRRNFQSHGDVATRHRGVSVRTMQTLLREYGESENKDVLFKKEKDVGPFETKIRSVGGEYVGEIGVGTVHRHDNCKDEKEILAGEGRLLSEDDLASSCRQPQEKLNVVFDTGSTNLWMASTLCDSGPCMEEGRKRYNHKQSETFKEPEEARTLDIKFSTAELKGPLGVDDFHIGPFTVKEQKFALIQQELGSTFKEEKLEGIVGLGFPSLAVHGTHPFFDNVITQKVLDKNMFAFYLEPWTGSTSDSLKQDTTEGGAILWGGVDSHLHNGDIKWFPVTHAYYWAIHLEAFYIGNEEMTVKASSSLRESEEKNSARVIVDTGTTLYAVDLDLHELLKTKLPKIPCSQITKDAYPDMTFRLKDADGSLFDMVLTNTEYMVQSANSDSCRLGFMGSNPLPDYGPSLTFGELFMAEYLTVFDRGTGKDNDARVGFARAKSGQLSSLLHKPRAF